MKSVFSQLKRKITVFPEKLSSENFDALYANLTEIKFFVGGVNTRLPLPKDAPEEIPRIILKSADDSISCQVSSQKIQIEWIPDVVNTEIAINLVSEILQKTIKGNVINRIGNIKEYVLEVREEQTFSSFLRPQVLGKLQDVLEAFSFDLTLKSSLSIEVGQEIRCNRFARVVSAIRDMDKQKLVVIMIDFNTHPEEKLSWGVESLKKFIIQSESKLEYEDVAQEILI